MKKPEPVPKAMVCSLCGLAWDKHPEKASAEDCIELLKVELARRPAPMWNQQVLPGSGFYATTS